MTYNPQKPGRPSHHPLACAIGGTRLCLHMEWRKGNTMSASGWIEATAKVRRSPIAQHRIRLNRGDLGFGQEPIMAWHEQGTGKRPAYLKNQGGHTEAINSRYELLRIPAKLVCSGRQKIVKLAVGGKFASFLKQAYQRLLDWLARTAPQLNLTMTKVPPWLLFDPTHAAMSPVA